MSKNNERICRNVKLNTENFFYTTNRYAVHTIDIVGVRFHFAIEMCGDRKKILLKKERIE